VKGILLSLSLLLLLLLVLELVLVVVVVVVRMHLRTLQEDNSKPFLSVFFTVDTHAVIGADNCCATRVTPNTSTRTSGQLA
jgi:hypothetical protein